MIERVNPYLYSFIHLPSAAALYVSVCYVATVADEDFFYLLGVTTES